MKKSKLSTGLVTSFIAAMALGACSNNVTADKTNVVDFTGYNDQKLAVAIDDIYNDYRQTSAGISAYYKQVIEVLIRNAFKTGKAGSKDLTGVRKNYDQIVNEAKNKVKSDKQSAKENADTNGTSYKTEWQSILSGKGVKDEAELLQYYIYELEKEVIEDWYFDENEEALTSEYIGVDNTGANTASTKAAARYPYHIRHILIKVEDGGSEFARGTISEAQAKLLSKTITELAKGKLTFGQAAYDFSEDSSNTSYGDVGLMTSAASSGSLGMVNEFQLGIYAYDSVLSGRTGVVDEIKKGLGLSSKISKELYNSLTNETATDDQTVQDTLTKLGLGELPYAKVVELGLAAEIETNKATGLKVGDGKSALYPRNILWNRYFNRHNAFVITNRAVDEATAYAGSTTLEDKANIAAVAAKEGKDLRTGDGATYSDSQNVKKYDVNENQAINFADLPRFKENANILAGGGKVLCDENDNVIIGVRSTYGIHLMVVQKSILDYADANITLNEYYTTAVPGDEDYPVDASGNAKQTYVNFIDTNDKSKQNERAQTVRSAIKGFDSTYDYRLYDLLSGKDDNIRSTLFAAESEGLLLLDEIDNYVALQREKNLYDQEEGIAKVWKTYLELLDVQKDYREDIPATGKAMRLIPEGCKIRFYSDQAEIDAAEYKEGGLCYVKD
ncbi:MAG: peptidylprolyl isomerase [Bacilli bacterium]|nr:peptidylprolyl isomerase [Bacilli bacterium]